MRYGSLFSGIGGLDLGLDRAGMECLWQVEIDDYCRRVLMKHWPSVKRFKDVREVGAHNLASVDLISGGFPCQPHSVAGKRRGAEDNRNLWPEFIRIIRETEPRYVLAENVPGIITTYLDTVLFDLESEDYTCGTFNVPAVALNAPHRRERIFIVAYTERKRWQGCNKHIRKEFEKSGCTEWNVADTSTMLGASIKRDEQDRVLSENVSNTNRTRKLQPEGSKSDKCGRISDSSWWDIEPDVGRVAHGVPSRVDRLRGLGNAVVPQVAEWIGKRIIEHALG